MFNLKSNKVSPVKKVKHFENSEKSFPCSTTSGSIYNYEEKVMLYRLKEESKNKDKIISELKEEILNLNMLVLNLANSGL